MTGDNIINISFIINNKLVYFILGAVITSALMIVGYVGEFIIFASDSPKINNNCN